MVIFAKIRFNELSVFHGLILPNAAPEWQAGTLERKQGVRGGLSTQGAC
jgi:hypothetical protein